MVGSRRDYKAADLRLRNGIIVVWDLWPCFHFQEIVCVLRSVKALGSEVR
jgi:hypothetical protein